MKQADINGLLEMVELRENQERADGGAVFPVVKGRLSLLVTNFESSKVDF